MPSVQSHRCIRCHSMFWGVRGTCRLRHLCNNVGLVARPGGVCSWQSTRRSHGLMSGDTHPVHRKKHIQQGQPSGCRGRFLLEVLQHQSQSLSSPACLRDCLCSDAAESNSSSAEHSQPTQSLHSGCDYCMTLAGLDSKSGNPTLRNSSFRSKA